MAEYLLPTDRLENGEGGWGSNVENCGQCMGAVEGVKKGSLSCRSPSKLSKDGRRRRENRQGMGDYGSKNQLHTGMGSRSK